jgi:hypothetical protein
MKLQAKLPDGTVVTLIHPASGGYLGHEWTQHDPITGDYTDGYPCIIYVENYYCRAAFLINPPDAPVELECGYDLIP